MQLVWRRYFARGSGELPPDMLKAVLCHEYKWSEEQFDNSSWPFVQACRTYLNALSEDAKRQMKKQ